LNQVKNYWKFLEIWQNMNIDFWAIAKWYFAEKMSKYILNKWYKNNLVNLWWDIYASGTNWEGKKWNIGIDSPFWQNEIIASMEISNSSISTSWTYLRNWEILWKKYHHIRNPYSLSCENDFVSVTILHMHWYMSDAIATAVIAMWKTKWIEFCTKNNILFFFVLQNGEIIKRNIL
jgi:thiamine biosynthesis lipoprotein